MAHHKGRFAEGGQEAQERIVFADQHSLGMQHDRDQVGEQGQQEYVGKADNHDGVDEAGADDSSQVGNAASRRGERLQGRGQTPGSNSGLDHGPPDRREGVVVVREDRGQAFARTHSIDELLGKPSRCAGQVASQGLQALLEWDAGADQGGHFVVQRDQLVEADRTPVGIPGKCHSLLPSLRDR